MASVTKLGSGKQPPRAIDFVDDTDGGKRKRIRIGVTSHDEAERFCRQVERLLTAKILNQGIDSETAKWLAGVPDSLHERIAQKGLCQSRQPITKAPKLEYWLTKYISQRRSDLKPGSIARLQQTSDRLIEHFGEVTIDAITPSMAADWRAAMVTEKLAEATIRLHTRNAKSMFTAAVNRELIHRNPFAKLKSSAIAATRERIVTLEETERLLAAAPSLQWRLLIGLARYAGLRVDSESHRLTWSDVDWERRRLRVFSSKTEKSKPTRLVPIVGALMTLLQDSYDAAPDGAVKIVTLSRNNLHRGFEAIVRRSGVAEWEDLFQTLRRSCESDLAKRHPQHAVSQWIGHSMEVSEKHYLIVDDELFDAAANDPVMQARTVTSTQQGSESNLVSMTATTSVSCLGAAESAAVSPRIVSQEVANGPEVLNSDFAEYKQKLAVCQDLRHTASSCEVDRGGIEPPTPGFSVLCSTD